MVARPVADTRERILAAATASFAARGFEATSLDGLAAGLEVSKQTILYHFGSKEGLLDRVIERTVLELDQTLRRAARGRADMGAVVDAVFRLGTKRPELLAVLREIVRLGPPASTKLTSALSPLLEQASAVLPESTVLAAYAMVIGMATEVEVLRSLGVEPGLAALRRRRRQLLAVLTPSAEIRGGRGGGGRGGPGPSRRARR